MNNSARTKGGWFKRHYALVANRIKDLKESSLKAVRKEEKKHSRMVARRKAPNTGAGFLVVPNGKEIDYAVKPKPVMAFKDDEKDLVEGV